MTTLDLMASAPLPARQPIGGQVPEVTACSLTPQDSQVLSCHPREGEVYALGLNRSF